MLGPGSIATPGGPFKPISHTLPPLIGLSGLGPLMTSHINSINHTSNAQCPPPPPSSSSNHLPPSRARGLPLFDAS